MSNANMSGIPGVGVMNDTLEFVKNMWGGMNLPGMVMPSLSVNDINKQIADLKAVESWLTLNMNMLRGTIQALEVQSATISTLHSMSESMNSMVQPPAAPARTAEPAHTRSHDRAETSNQSARSSAPAAYDPAFSFAPPTAEKPPAPKSDSEPEPQPASAARAPANPMAGPDGLDPAAMAAQFANPAAWWNMLQDQFKQAVNTAVVAEPAAPAKASRAASGAKTKSVSKTKTKAKAAPSRKAKAAPSKS